MKQKLFTLLTALLFLNSGAWATEINLKMDPTVNIANKKVALINGAYVTRNGSNTSVTSNGFTTGGGNSFVVFNVTEKSIIKAYLCNTSNNAYSGKTISCGSVSSEVWTALGTAQTNDTQYQMTTSNVTSATNKTVAFDKNNKDAVKTYEFVATTSGYYSVYWASTINASVYLTKIEIIPAESVTIGATGWSTYSNAKVLDFANAIPSDGESDALKAYMVTGFSGTALTKSDALDDAPGSTGLLLNGTAGETYTIPVLASSSTSTASNCLQASVSGGTVTAGTGTNVNYVLMNVGGSPVFQWIGATSATLGANKAYLTLDGGPKSAGAHGLWFDDETTGVASVSKPQTTTNQEVYNLAGQRVAQPTKGLYILNGKKVVIK